MLLKNLKSARRGAACGPSGITTEHLRPLLDSEEDCDCQAFARARIPDEVLSAVRMGRITALQKPSGGIRGIVVGDSVRRLVSRTIAQQIGPAVEVATAPHQYAMSTRAGCESIAHLLQARTDQDHRATVLSIDGIGAFDLVSRESMLRGLSRVEGGATYIWQDEKGVVHDIPQGEGGEQGDALMPALFSLGQHPAFEAVRSQLLEGKRFALSWTMSTLCVALIEWCPYSICSSVSCGYVPGFEPPGCHLLTEAARRLDPTAIVWRGDHTPR